MPQAGAGGSAGQPVAAGIGGGGGGSIAIAGSGGGAGSAGSAPAAGSGGSDGSCPTSYTVATHITMNVKWDSSLALTSGTGQVHIWTKSKFVESGGSATVTTFSCGSILPVVTTSAIAGSSKVLPEIPDTAWDKPTMPTFMSTATKQGSAFSTDAAIALVGLTMSDPTGGWPAVGSIMGVDHDNDGKPGITAIPRVGDGFQAPPTSLSQTSRTDKLYLATRNIMTLQATVEGCPASYDGTATVTKFDSHVIGCHVKDGDDCSSSESKFVDDNRSVFKVNNATFQAARVADTIDCTGVRAALPLQ